MCSHSSLRRFYNRFLICLMFSPLRPAWLPCTATNEQPPNKHVTQIQNLNWAKKNRVRSHKSITNLPLVAKQKVRRHGKFGARTNAPRLESIGTNIPASRKPCSTLLSTKNTYVEQETEPGNVWKITTDGIVAKKRWWYHRNMSSIPPVTVSRRTPFPIPTTVPITRLKRRNPRPRPRARKRN